MDCAIQEELLENSLIKVLGFSVFQPNSRAELFPIFEEWDSGENRESRPELPSTCFKRFGCSGRGWGNVSPEIRREMRETFRFLGLSQRNSRLPSLQPLIRHPRAFHGLVWREEGIRYNEEIHSLVGSVYFQCQDDRIDSMPLS